MAPTAKGSPADCSCSTAPPMRVVPFVNGSRYGHLTPHRHQPSPPTGMASRRWVARHVKGDSPKSHRTCLAGWCNRRTRIGVCVCVRGPTQSASGSDATGLSTPGRTRSQLGHVTYQTGWSKSPPPPPRPAPAGAWAAPRPRRAAAGGGRHRWTLTRRRQCDRTRVCALDGASAPMRAPHAARGRRR